jgi:hypothetical protein
MILLEAHSHAVRIDRCHAMQTATLIREVL